MKPQYIVALGTIALVVVAVISVTALDLTNREIKEKTFAERTSLRFTEHCLKGRVVLKITGEVSSDTGYLYDLNAGGHPKSCP